MENKALRRLEERMATVQPGTIRHEALEAAKRFKSSWIDLGRILWTVHKEKKFKEWGYISFEGYCSKEVGIREATAKKLLHSYYFLEKEEPTLLKQLADPQERPAQVPQVDAVNMLRLLSKKESVPQEDYRKVRSYVLEQGRDLPEVRKEVQSVLQASASVSPEKQSGRRQALVRRMIGTLKTLRDELVSEEAVPEKLLDEIDRLMKKLSEFTTER